MAGDWIPASVGLTRKREVIAIARETGRDRYQVVGILMEFWGWASGETADGRISGVRIDDLPAILGIDVAFWRSMQALGWLEETSEGIEIPNADNWMTTGAKARLQKNRRQAAWREGVDANVDAQPSTRPSTDAPTTEQNRTEENRREEKRQERVPTELSSADADATEAKYPLPIDPSQFVESWNESANRLGLPTIRQMTGKRKQQFRQRCRDPAWVDGWREALDRIGKSEFLRGNSDRGWQANVDWFLRPDTVTKILEGNYERKNSGMPF